MSLLDVVLEHDVGAPTFGQLCKKGLQVRICRKQDLVSYLDARVQKDPVGAIDDDPNIPIGPCPFLAIAPAAAMMRSSPKILNASLSVIEIIKPSSISSSNC